MQINQEQTAPVVAAQPAATTPPVAPEKFPLLKQFATDLKSTVVNYLIAEHFKSGTEEVSLDNLEAVVNVIATAEKHSHAHRLVTLQYIIAAGNYVLALRESLIAQPDNKMLKAEVQLFIGQTLECLDTLANHSRKTAEVSINGNTFKLQGLLGFTRLIGMTGSDLAANIHKFHADWNPTHVAFSKDTPRPEVKKSLDLIVLEMNPPHASLFQGELTTTDPLKLNKGIIINDDSRVLLEGTVANPAPGLVYADLDEDSRLNLQVNDAKTLEKLNEYTQRFKAEGKQVDADREAAIEAKKAAAAAEAQAAQVKAQEEAAAAKAKKEADKAAKATPAPAPAPAPAQAPAADAPAPAPAPAADAPAAANASEELLPPAVVETPAPAATSTTPAPVVVTSAPAAETATVAPAPAAETATVAPAPAASTSTAPASTFFQQPPVVEQQPVAAQEQAAENNAEVDADSSSVEEQEESNGITGWLVKKFFG